MDPVTGLDPTTLNAFQKLWAMLGIDFESTMVFSGVVTVIIAALKSATGISGWKTHVASIVLSGLLAINGYVVASTTVATFGSWVGVLFSTLFCWLIPMGGIELAKHLLSKHGEAVGSNLTPKP